MITKAEIYATGNNNNNSNNNNNNNHRRNSNNYIGDYDEIEVHGLDVSDLYITRGQQETGTAFKNFIERSELKGTRILRVSPALSSN